MPEEHSQDELKAIFAQAAEIAKAVPDSMQEAAFNRALDALLAVATDPHRRAGTASRRAAKRSATPQPSRRKSGADDRVTKILSELDRTKYPTINSTRKALDAALLVLSAAQDLKIEALTPGQISQVLREKFRVTIQEPAVRMALGGAGKLVDRRPEGTGFAYRLMEPGEEYLNVLGQQLERKDETVSKRGKQETA